MNRVFSITAPFRVPDGTWVSPFLNAKDGQSDLPFDLLDGFSLAAGVIDPNSCSKIHVMPFVIQVTFVRSGDLAVKMKGPDEAEPYILRLTAGQAVLTEPGVFFQLINEGSERCEVLYIVSPAYVFEMSPEGAVLYDDAAVLEEGCNYLAATGWRTARSMATAEQRADAMRRLSEIKRKKSKP
jgi:mannose-6-phosphate isomerase-like protein (cupin superfamily)